MGAGLGRFNPATGGMGPDGDEGAQDQYPAANPHPDGQGVHVDAEGGRGTAGLPAIQHHVDILQRRHVEAHFTGGHLGILVVDVAARQDGAQQFAVLLAEDHQPGAVLGQVGVPPLLHAAVDQLIAPQGDSFPLGQGDVGGLLVEFVADDGYADEDDAQVHDVAAVAAAVPP